MIYVRVLLVGQEEEEAEESKDEVEKRKVMQGVGEAGGKEKEYK